LIAKHAAVTQAGAQGDAAIVARVESSIKNSPMGWLQGILGETSSRASSEQSQVSGKIAEHKDLVANQKDVPKDAGPPPAPGPAAHPAVPHPAAPAKAAVAAPAPAAGGAAEHHAPIAGAAVPKSAPAAAPAAAPAPTVASAVAGAGDSQIDGILNGYTPKGQQSTQTIGRIKSMGDVAQGFNGQLDTYIAQGGAVEHGIAATANFLGAGKDVSAVWATNPYRKVHGILGGIMTGMSAVKNVCGVVGSICGKLGMVLTVIGLLGMIFPPIGAAVSGIARILSVVGLICDSISFVLSGILTGLNGVVLAQQIAAGASAEEKAATADLMMSEANEAASGFVNLAMVFGPKFMKGLLGNSKGIVASLIKRAKATIGRISLKLSANVSHFANKIVRKLGFGGSSFERVGGAWKDTGLLANTKAKWAGSKVGKAFTGAPQHLQAVQEKLMAKYGSTAWAKGMDRVGAWGGSVAHKLERFDLGEQAGRLGEKSGKAVGGAFADTNVGKSMAAAAERSELQTRELTMKMEARDAAHLEESRWKNQLDRRQTANPDHVREPGAETKFVAGQGQKVRDEKVADFQSQERQRDAKDRLEQLRTERFERRNDEFYDNKTNGITGVGKRDEMMAGVHNTRERRYSLEAEFKPQETERKELLAKTTKSAAEQERLTALNGELRRLDEARRVNKMYETDLSGLASGAERVRAPEYNNWKDVGSNAWEATAPALEMLHLKDQDSAWAVAEKADLKKQTKYNKGTAQANAAGRGGHGTFADIATDARHRELDELTEFVRAAPQTRSVSSSVRGMLSPIVDRAAPAAPAAATAAASAPATATPDAATQHAPTPAPQAVGPGPAHEPGGVTVQPTGEHHEGNPVGASMQVAAQVHEAPAGAPAHDEQKDAGAPAPDEAGGEALPYWPALIPEFDQASHDFGWMRTVAVEFKKAQIEGKQKAVDTLAVYGRYKEYAAARAASAQKNSAAAAQTGQATQQNVSHAAQTEGQASQGEQKQGEAKGAANDRAATDLPEPESRGFWGRILGAVKRWAKNKAAQVFGWIQEKIASVILKGLCGVSMGDMRDYAGALRRQQQAAHGVADGAGKTSGQAQQTSIKLSSDATKEAQGAADAIGECDKNIVDADQFMADIGSFEQQLAEEKAHAQMFIASVHAAAEAERTKQQQEAAAHAAEEKKEQDRAAQLGGGSGAPAAAAPQPAPAPAPTATPDAGEPAHASEGNEQDISQIHAASQYVATESEAMTQKLEARADDYTNQLALALTNRTGKSADGVDLKGPAKKESKHIVEEFKTAAQHTKIDMEAFHNMSIDPSQSKRIAEQIISSAQYLEETYNHSENTLDELFARTYNGIKDGRRTLKSRMLDGDNAVGAVNHAGDTVDNTTIDTALPKMNTAWETVAKPIQAPTAPAAPAAPATAVASASAAPPKLAKAKSGESFADDGKDSRPGGGGQIPFRADMERAFGQDFGTVTVSFGAHGDMGELGARGVTQGEHITFADTSPDRELVAHELTHIVQQRQGRVSGTPAGVDARERGHLEHEADSVAAKVASGDHAGEIAGQTQATGFREDNPKAADVVPPAQVLQVVGDRFTLTFRKTGKEVVCDVKYEGGLETLGKPVEALGAQLLDPTRKLNAKITNVGPASVTVDLYGDGLTIATFTDRVRPDVLIGRNVRYHTLSWHVGQLGTQTDMTIYIPADANGPGSGAAATKFHAVDDFNVSAVRFGDAKSVAVTLSGTGEVPNPQTFDIPIDGKLDKIAPKVVSNDGRTIKLDFNGDGKVDLTLVHTVEARTEPGGKIQSRMHHFRRFDKDGVLMGDYKGGMLFGNGGAPVAIPKAQDESQSAPDVDKEAPFSRAPAQADNAGELPLAIAGPGGVIEMRIDGDGDRTKELAIRLKPIAGANAEAQGQMKLEMIQLSSAGATNKAETMTINCTADAVKAFEPWISQVADGFNPTIIQVISSVKSGFGAKLELKISAPTNDTTAKTRTYGVDFGGTHANLTFPAETTPENPLVKTAGTAQTVGGVTRLETTLGEFGDRFWVMHEPQASGKDVLSVVALNADAPAASQNVPLALGKPITSFTKVNAGGNNLALDLDGDGKADVQLFDALSQPVGMTYNKPVLADRDHTITVVGAGTSAKLYPFIVRDGKFAQHEPDKEAAAGSHAAQLIGDQADDSRSKDENGVAKEGDINALLSRIAGALAAARLKAKQAGLINDKLYTAWASLSEELIQLGPQINAKKVDVNLQKLAAGNAATFCAELTEATKSADKTIAASDGGTTIGNDYTGKIDSITMFKTFSSGPTLRLQNEITAGDWGNVTKDFTQLVTGLDKWIGDKQKPGSDDQKQQQYLAGMQEQMTEIKGKPGVQRVMASFQPDASYNTNTQKWGQIPLMLFSWKEDNKWYLRDITSPDRQFTDKVDASPNDKEPPASIFQQLDYAKHFPKGVLHYQIPGGAGGQIVTTERKHWTDFLQWVGLGLAVIGFSLATFGTGAVAATAAAVAFAGAGVAGAVYAGGDLYERAKHGDLEPAAVVMDVAQIVAGIFGAGAAISGRIVTAAAQADLAAANGVEGAAAWSGAAARVAQFSQKLYIPALAASTGADGVNLLAMSADTIAKIQQIKNGDGSPDDKKSAIAQLIAQTLVLGGITVLSIKGSMPEIIGGRPTIAIDVINGIPVARANTVSVGGTRMSPKGDANAQATARWQSQEFQDAIPADPRAKGASEDPGFMKGYKAWMEQPEPKVVFIDGKPKANFGKGVDVPPEVKTKIQTEVVDRGGVSLYEKAWTNTDSLQKVEDAVAQHGGLDVQPGSKSWRDHRAEIVKALGGDAKAEELVVKYERVKVGADGADPRAYVTQRTQLERIVPENEIHRLRDMFKEYEVYVTGGATQTGKVTDPNKLQDLDLVVVVPRGTPPELCAAIEQRARGQVVRPDPAYLQANGLDANRTLTVDVKVMTEEQFFGFVTASPNAKQLPNGEGRTELNFTRIDVEPESLDAAVAKGGSGQQWLDRLEKRLDAAGKDRIKQRMAPPHKQSAQDIMSEFSGDFELAVGELSKPGGEKPAPTETSVSKYTNGPVPADIWGYAGNEANWKPARRALHDQWIAKAKLEAQQFADALEKANPGSEATIFAMRGNTAAGKTRAVTGNVPEMQGPMASTSGVRHRAVNPDNFKLEIYAADPGMTSTQVHVESSVLAQRLEKELLGLKTTSGKDASILIDKRLASVRDVEQYMKMAQDSGRKFVLYDVDAPLEASLVGVLERRAGESDPLPPFDIVAGGFTSVRNDRLDVIKLFERPGNGTYTLYGTRADGARVEIASVAGGAPSIKDPGLFAEAVAPAAAQAQLIGAKRINDDSIKAVTSGLDPARAQKIVAILRKYEGWTWREALDAHAVEKPAVTPPPAPGK
jgi:hypothetical protein